MGKSSDSFVQIRVIWPIETMTKMKALETLIERAASLTDEAQAEFVDAMADVMEKLETKHAASIA